jgi:hypothetical protein
MTAVSMTVAAREMVMDHLDSTTVAADASAFIPLLNAKMVDAG